MLRLKTKLVINSRVEVKCEKHPTYNPEKHGQGAIKGGCSRCNFLYSIFATQQRFLNTLKDYQQLTTLYEKVVPRQKKVVPEIAKTTVV